jgi:outer membrane protein assembly factor BamB
MDFLFEETTGKRKTRRGRGSRVLLIILLVLMLAGGGYWIWSFLTNYRPLISSIPLVQPGGQVTVNGARFGTQALGANLVKPDGSTVALQVVSWSPGRIVVNLPDQISAGSIAITAQTFLGKRTSLPRGFVIQSAGLPSLPNGYETPVQADSPWPTFRRDEHNTGASLLPAVYAGDKPWFFQTGKGLFVTPVIDGKGTIYIGSADHYFNAINPDGYLKWKYQTGEIIDSAAALTDPDPLSGADTITFISGDGKMYRFRTDDVPM